MADPSQKPTAGNKEEITMRGNKFFLLSFRLIVLSAILAGCRDAQTPAAAVPSPRSGAPSTSPPTDAAAGV
jgi:hypothetical protein